MSRRVNGVTYTQRITASLRRAGYATWKQPATLHASDFGVSQNRRRLFFVGVGPGVALPAVPTPTHVPPSETPPEGTLPHTATLIERLQDLPNLGPGEGSERFQTPHRERDTELDCNEALTEGRGEDQGDPLRRWPDLVSTA